MSLENFKQLLSELGQTTGIPDLAPDEDNYCCLGFDEKIIVHLQFNPETDILMLFCELGIIDEDKTIMLYPKILKANLFWQGTSGSTIGVDDENRTVLMGYQTPIAYMDFQKFQETLETFINTAELWINTLQEIQKNALPIKATPASEMPKGIKA